jgi:uncharacterized protein
LYNLNMHMKDNILRKPLIGQGWLRVLVFMVSFLLLTGITLFSILKFVLKQSAEITETTSAIAGNTYLFVIVVFLIGILVTFVFRRWIDRKSFLSMGLDVHDRLHDAIAGLGLSVFIIGISSLFLQFSGYLKWTDIIYDPKNLFLSLGAIILIAFYEELIFRGYVLNNLMESMPKWLALGISSLLFMLVESFGPHAGFFSWINTLVMGLILGLNYIYTRNLLFSIFFHAGWLFIQGPLLGFTLNANFPTLLQTELYGNENISGGANGLQGSLVLVVVSLLGLAVLYFFLQNKLRKQSQPAPDRI